MGEVYTKKIGSDTEVYTQIYTSSTGRLVGELYTLRLVGRVHTTLSYTTPPGKKIGSVTLLDYTLLQYV